MYACMHTYIHTWLKATSCSSRQPRKPCSCAVPLASIARTSSTARNRDKHKYTRSLLAIAEIFFHAIEELFGAWQVSPSLNNSFGLGENLNYHFARSPFETKYLPGQFGLGHLIDSEYDTPEHMDQAVYTVCHGHCGNWISSERAPNAEDAASGGKHTIATLARGKAKEGYRANSHKQRQ